jgi:tRNA(His) guanylyltransferase
MKDALGDRMKEYYENRFRFKLPRRTYTIIRIDGKSFHTYTKGLKRPFDSELMEDMDETTKYLCKNIQGAKFGYVQSDEISILITDFDDLQTDMWFDGNIQKMVSVSASMATSKFNQLRLERILKNSEKIDKLKLAEFDARVFQIPYHVEVENYFIWRQQDASKNSISSVALSLYSHKELEGKNSTQKQEMIFQKGINWNNYSTREKRGGFITKSERIIYPLGSVHAGLSKMGTGPGKYLNQPIIRNFWESIECPIFTQDRDFLSNKILKPEQTQ